MTYKNHEVKGVELNGAIVNVNGTSITDLKKMGKLMGQPSMYGDGYTVFCDSDELFFRTFDEAYIFATTKQKDTMRL